MDSVPWAEHHKNENHHFSKELNKQRSGYNSYFDIVERCQKDVDDVHRLSSIKRLARKIRQSFCTGRLPLGGGGGRAKRSSIRPLDFLDVRSLFLFVLLFLRFLGFRLDVQMNN